MRARQTRRPLEPSNMVRIACAVVALLLSSRRRLERSCERSAARPPAARFCSTGGCCGGSAARRDLAFSPRRSPAARRPSSAPSRRRSRLVEVAGRHAVARRPRARPAHARARAGACSRPGPTARSRRLAANVGEAPFDPLRPGAVGHDAGVVTLEGGVRRVLAQRERAGDRRSRCPPGADPELVGVGRLGRRRAFQRGRAGRLRSRHGHRGPPDLARALRPDDLERDRDLAGRGRCG